MPGTLAFTSTIFSGKLMALSQIDNYASFRFIETKLDGAVKRGAMSREQAKKVLDEARQNYRDNRYNKLIDPAYPGKKEISLKRRNSEGKN